MVEIFNKLPNELLQMIMSYDDRFKYRNGKWISQIPKSDSRYNVIKNINRTIVVTHNMISFIILGKECHLTIFGGFANHRISIDYYYRFVKYNYNRIYRLW